VHVGVLCFRHRRFFVPTTKEKQNFAAEWLMPRRPGKDFQKSTTVSQTAIYLIITRLPATKWIWCVQLFQFSIYTFKQTGKNLLSITFFFKFLFEQPLLLVLSDFAPQSGFRMHHMLWRWKCICWGVSENYL
jgi:hypothetical protein